MTEVETNLRDLERFRPLIGDTKATRGLSIADRLQ